MTYYVRTNYSEDTFIEANNTLKKELQSKLNPQYKEYMTDKNEVLLRPYIKNSNINELTPNHIEFIALTLMDDYLKNPYLIKGEIDDVLGNPVDMVERGLIRTLLLNLIEIYRYNDDDRMED